MTAQTRKSTYTTTYTSESDNGIPESDHGIPKFDYKVEHVTNILPEYESPPETYPTPQASPKTTPQKEPSIVQTQSQVQVSYEPQVETE